MKKTQNNYNHNSMYYKVDAVIDFTMEFIPVQLICLLELLPLVIYW